jgi:hypothetical protein
VEEDQIELFFFRIFDIYILIFDFSALTKLKTAVAILASKKQPGPVPRTGPGLIIE